MLMRVSLRSFFLLQSDVCDCFILIFFSLLLLLHCMSIDVYMSAKCLALSRFLALVRTERVAAAAAAAIDVVATAVLWNCI